MPSSKFSPFWYWLGYGVTKALGSLFFSFKVINRERIIEDGGVIIAMNHESYIDPPIAAISCRKPIHFLARKSLLDWPIFGKLMLKVNVVPVDQERDMSALKTLIKVIRSGERAIVFPEGARTEDGALQAGMPGIGLVVAKTLAPVVPMRIFGAHQAFPRGGNSMKMHPVRVVVGEPLYFTKEEIKAVGKEAYPQISNRIMEAISAIQLPQDEEIVN